MAAVQSRDPVSGAVVFSIESASSAEIERALALASDAWPRWSVAPVEERARVLRSFADIIDAEAARLAELIVLEVGKRRSDARGEVEWTALSARWYADNPPVDEIVDGALVRHMPLGVITAITPWNVPLVTPAWKWLPALISGNAVIWKPSELSTGIAVEAAKIFARAGLPDGLLQVVPGAAEVAIALCSDERVKGIHFTGSTRAGRSISTLVAPRFARAALEMGGVNAAVVFPDADIDLAADAIVASGTALAGQKCTAIRRVIVHETASNSLIDALSARISALTVGHPDDESTDVGPMISVAASATARGTVEAAVDRGGVVLARPEVPAGDGAWFAPTLVGGLARNDPLTADEVFAPILILETFGDDEDPWALANASGYGLSGAVYTSNSETVERSQRAMNVGVLAINGRSDAVGLTQPFGGRGLSGNGQPEGGRYVYTAVTDRVVFYHTT